MPEKELLWYSARSYPSYRGALSSQKYGLRGIDTSLPHHYLEIMIILFTDLDGTLLDESTYSADPAREGLSLINELGLPLVFCTSKTRAEVEHLRATLGNSHPFIVENGGALYVPDGYFAPGFRAPAQRDAYGVFEFGIPYDDLVETLWLASRETGCRVLGFHDMSVKEISRKCNLSLEQARLAKIREYDEPFEILDPPGNELLQAIECRGKKWTRGGRLHHITGDGNKAHGICLLTYYYRSTFETIITVGLGDGWNDLDFLRCVDIPIIVKSKAAERLKSALPRARLTEQTGPEGWSRAVLEILDQHAALTATASNVMAGKMRRLAFHRCFQTASSGLSGISDSLPAR